MSSSSSLVSSSSRIGEEEEDNGNPPPTSMLVGFQHLEERIIIATTSTCTNTNTQLPVVPSISTIIGCDITIDDIQSTKQELVNQKFDLKMDVNKRQKLTWNWNVTPLLHFCGTGNLLIIKLLFLIGADCTRLCERQFWFPMLVAAGAGCLDICKWIFEYGGDAKYQINKEISDGYTPLQQSYELWSYGWDKGGKTCRWLLLNGGGRHYSSNAMRRFVEIADWKEKNRLVMWIRENMQLHDTFILLLCGAATMNATLLSSEISDGSTRNSKRQRKGGRKRKIHRERSLQILDGHPGIMELIGDYVGLIRGKEIRMLQEFNELVIQYNTTNEN